MTPLITSMEGGDVLLCHTLTPTDMRIERYDPALRMRWSTLFQLSGEGMPLGHVEPRRDPLEEERLAMPGDFTPREIVFPPFVAGNYIVLVSAVHDTTSDSTCAMGRFFDRETGRLLHTNVLHRGEVRKYSEDHGYRVAISPDSSKFLLVRAWRGTSLSESDLDIMVFSSAIPPQDVPLQRARLNGSRMEIKDICINNAGDIIVTRQTISTSVILHKFRAPDYSSSRDVSFTLSDPDGTGRNIGFYKVLPAGDGGAILLSGEHVRKKLNRVNLIRFNFHDSSSVLRNYVEFSPEVFKEMIGEKEFEDAMLHSVLTTGSPERHIAIFEQRAKGELYYTNFQNRQVPRPSEISGSILLVGFDGVGDSVWVRAIERKIYIPDPNYIGLSFNAAISPRNTLQLIYRGPNQIILNEFRPNDGESLTGTGSRYLLETGSAAFLYRPSITWLKDGAVLMLFNQGNFSQEINAYRVLIDR